jgi:hypothetical protein
MFRRTFTGSLVAASLAAGALLTMPAAQAEPTFVQTNSTSGIGFLPASADVAVADNGAAVATWVAGGRVMAASTDGQGHWGPAKFVSDPGKEVATSSVAVNDNGDAAITWSQKDGSNNIRLAVSRRLANHQDWDGWVLVSAPVDKDVANKADIGLDSAGTLQAAYVATDGGSFNQVRVMTQAKGTIAFTTANLSDTDAFTPSLAVNSAGAALVSWLDVEGPESLIRSRRVAAPGGTWTAAKDVSPLGSYLAATDTALSDNGFGSIAFVRNFNGDARVEAVKVLADNFITSANFVSPAGEDASQVSLDQNDTGTALLSWVAAGDTTEIGYATRPQNGGWTAHELNSPVASPGRPRSAIAETGTILVGYVGNAHLLASYDTPDAAPMQHVDFNAWTYIAGSTLVGIDAQGNAFLGGIRQSNPGEGEVLGMFLDVAGPASTVTEPTAPLALAPNLTVAWSATDRLLPVTRANVRVRSAAFNGDFGAHSPLALGTLATSLPFAGVPGSTHCFSVQSEDEADNLGPWSAERCTTLPVDDRSLTRVKGFKTRAGSGHYLGTFVKARKKGSKLTLDNVRASRLAVIVAKAPKGGRIKVLFAGQNLGSYSLKGTGTTKSVAVKDFGALRTGKLVIKVISRTGKVVKIDGVVASR